MLVELDDVDGADVTYVEVVNGSKVVDVDKDEAVVGVE